MSCETTARGEEREGFIQVLGHKLYVRQFLGGDHGVVLCLHGGPGASHEFLLPLARLAAQGYRVVLYDQVGAGHSTKPPAPGPYNVEHYVRELEGVCTALDLGNVHMFGWSWGGMLAMAHALEFPGRALSLINCGGPCSVPLFLKGVRRLLSELPPEDGAVIRKHEVDGDATDPLYRQVLTRVKRLHSYRRDEQPEELERAAACSGGPAHEVMWGDRYFDVTGTLRSFDLSDRLDGIGVPCLLMCGRYDNVVPDVMEDIARRIPSSRLVIFEESSHLPMWEEPQHFYDVMTNFLASIPGEKRAT